MRGRDKEALRVLMKINGQAKNIDTFLEVKELQEKTLTVSHHGTLVLKELYANKYRFLFADSNRALISVISGLVCPSFFSIWLQCVEFFFCKRV